jgi:hypothetical protein
MSSSKIYNKLFDDKIEKQSEITNELNKYE